MPTAPDRSALPPLPRWLAEELARGARPGAGPDAHRAMAEAREAREARDWERARRAAIRAKQAAPRSAAVREILGIAAFALGEWREAIQEFQAYRRLSGKRTYDPMIARALVARGRIDPALDLLDEVAATHPAPPLALEMALARAEALIARGDPEQATLVLHVAARATANAKARARIESVLGRIGRAGEADI